ncbi:hypothetical protein H2O64_04135 [Kordia sp. YSTF-M3]|uniref:MFS transporter n=1 Tax=Kordia aestuariivivens TaxID=2759037 RepID=A0ABR7Q5L8_9FLAO|nr:hypothetical protein [Kordia aestuariivivens]MBC8753845.1 hypothetical protein [Kordia aestuariivivens]
MSKKIARRLVRNFYFFALLLNVVIPWAFAKIVIGDRSGEIQLLYIGVGIWSIASGLLYTIYFAIPDFYKNWEKVATFLFPSLFCSPMLFYSSRILLIPFGINLAFNILCLFHYKTRIMNRSEESIETI